MALADEKLELEFVFPVALLDVDPSREPGLDALLSLICIFLTFPSMLTGAMHRLLTLLLIERLIVVALS